MIEMIESHNLPNLRNDAPKKDLNLAIIQIFLPN